MNCSFHPVNTPIILIYAPPSAADEENVVEFYGKLQEQVEQVPKGNVLIIMRDWIAKLEKQEHGGIAGNQGLGV